MNCSDPLLCTCDHTGVVGGEHEFTASIGEEACNLQCLGNPSCMYTYCEGKAPCSCHEYTSCALTRTPQYSGVNYKKVTLGVTMTPAFTTTSTTTTSTTTTKNTTTTKPMVNVSTAITTTMAAQDNS